MNQILYTLTFLLTLTSLGLHAQGTDKKDHITNGSFEAANVTKLKKLGQFSLVTGWTTANEEKVDLFSKGAAYPDVGAPNNVMGISNPKDGDNYVGIATHQTISKDGRGYITAPLAGSLVKDKKYCLSYSISLADGAKYATNNLGFHLSRKAVFEEKDIILLDDVMLPRINGAQKNMDGWEDICIAFQAKGGESFITVGNFASSTRTVAERMRQPAGFKGEQQQMGYYFLDDISLVEVARESDCNCAKKDEIEGPRIIFSKSAALKDNASLEDKIKSSSVYFYSNEDDLVGVSKRDLDALVVLLEESSSTRLTISGHMDSPEVKKGKEYDKFKDLSATRAEAVKAYLVEKGISGSRLTVDSHRDEKPATKMSTPLSLAKNRRVEFTIR